MATSLPLIDLSPFLSPSESTTVEDKKAAVASLARALEEHGFFYLVNHPIPREQLQNVLEVVRHYFTTASEDEKNAIARKDPGEGGDGARGYQQLQSNVTQGQRDFHEAIDFYRPVALRPIDPTDPSKGHALIHGPNLWPSASTKAGKDFRSTIEPYINDVLRIGDDVMVAMAWALGYTSPSDERIFLSSTTRPFWVARMISYPPLPPDSPGVSCGEHSDYGCTTFLLADAVPGALQVRGKDGEWMDVDIVEGAFVVNIGDMMERWTNGLWKSTKHRVVHRGSKTRVSAPVFYEPDWDAKIGPLKKAVERTGGRDKWGVKKYGDHIVEKVGGNFYGGGS